MRGHKKNNSKNINLCMWPLSASVRVRSGSFNDFRRCHFYVLVLTFTLTLQQLDPPLQRWRSVWFRAWPSPLRPLQPMGPRPRPLLWPPPLRALHWQQQSLKCAWWVRASSPSRPVGQRWSNRDWTRPARLWKQLSLPSRGNWTWRTPTSKRFLK